MALATALSALVGCAAVLCVRWRRRRRRAALHAAQFAAQHVSGGGAAARVYYCERGRHEDVVPGCTTVAPVGGGSSAGTSGEGLGKGTDGVVGAEVAACACSSSSVYSSTQVDEKRCSGGGSDGKHGAAWMENGLEKRVQVVVAEYGRHCSARADVQDCSGTKVGMVGGKQARDTAAEEDTAGYGGGCDNRVSGWLDKTTREGRLGDGGFAGSTRADNAEWEDIEIESTSDVDWPRRSEGGWTAGLGR